MAWLVAESLDDDATAKHLGITRVTVQTYLRRSCWWLHAKSRAELVAWVAARCSSAYREASLRRANIDASVPPLNLNHAVG
jgi:hypothetical protein